MVALEGSTVAPNAVEALEEAGIYPGPYRARVGWAHQSGKSGSDTVPPGEAHYLEGLCKSPPASRCVSTPVSGLC